MSKEQPLITSVCYKSIEDVDRGEWDSLVDAAHIVNSYDYLQAVERADLENFDFFYLIFYHKGRAVAHCPLVTFDYNIELMAGPFMKAFARKVRRFFPRFLKLKILECGLATQLGASLTIESNRYDRAVLEELDRAVMKLQKSESCLVTLIRDFSNLELDRFKHLLSLNYKLFLALPNTIMFLDQGSFGGYLQSLKHKRRYEVKRRLRRFHERGCSVEKVYNTDAYSKDFLELWFNVYDKSTEMQREILNREYFENMSSFLGEKAYSFVCKREGRVIAFMMILEGEDRLVPIYCGMDYKESKLSYSYFVMLYKTIEEALNRGKNLIQLGITTYTPKVEIGMIVEPLHVFSKSTNPLFSLIFAPIMSLATEVPVIEGRKIFNSSYLASQFKESTVTASFESRELKVKMMTEAELVLLGKAELEGGKRLALKVSDGRFALHIEVQRVSSRELSNGEREYTLKIIKVKREDSSLFTYFIERFAAKNNRRV